MRKLILLIFLLVNLCVFAQDTEQVKKLLSEGIELHDKRDYKGAMAKYDEALAINPDYHWAMYEKSYSMLAIKDYEGAIKILNKVLKDSKDPVVREYTYVNYGTALDLSGDANNSVKLYKEGIREFPNHYLLHFNLGVTLAGKGELAEAEQHFKSAVNSKPLHAGSHQALGRINLEKNRIPSILALITFLLVEPTGERAKQNLGLLNKSIMKGINKKSEKNTEITIDASMLDKKNKPKEDDFTSADMMLSLIAANDQIADSLKLKTDADKLDVRLQLLINIIDESEKSGKAKGFYKNFYVPFFVAMKNNKLMNTAAHLVLSESGKSDNDEWLSSHEKEIEEFYEWLKNYKWSKVE